MECARVSKTIFAPRKIASLAVTLSSCRWLARRVLSMVGALPHQPKPGHYFTSDIDAYLHYKEPRRARVRARHGVLLGRNLRFKGPSPREAALEQQALGDPSGGSSVRSSFASWPRIRPDAAPPQDCFSVSLICLPSSAAAAPGSNRARARSAEACASTFGEAEHAGRARVSREPSEPGNLLEQF
jgi:hypothetical protein